MIHQDIVLVLGAGASAPFGFPLGGKFKDAILNEGCSALHDDGRAHEATRFGSKFRQSLVPSIDAFLQKRAHLDESFDKAGRYAIAAALLPHEVPSVVESRNWYGGLFHALQTAHKADVGVKLKIITFNYDRSLEYHLHRAFIATYDMDEDSAAAELCRHVEVIHAYGSLGVLPFLDELCPQECRPSRKDEQGRELATTVPYGTRDFKTAADCIRIIGRDHGGDHVRRIAETIYASQVIGFLGFGFQPENMKLLGMGRLQQRPIIASGTKLPDGVKYELMTRHASCQWFFGHPDDDIGQFLYTSNLFGLLSQSEVGLDAYIRARRQSPQMGR